ncbi:hypothetical protein JNUCC64_04855 [Streptomyces sp. JNUCC 64]
MLTARSSSEAHLYMDLHPCECGSSDFDRRHRLEERDDDLVTIYEGTCQKCGRLRTFIFHMPDEIPPPPPAFGGAESSKIIDPGEFAEVAFRTSESAGIQLLNTPETEHHKFRDMVAYSISALEEVLKFIPDGQSAVPAGSFTSEVGRNRYQRDPGNFTREIIEMDIRDARAVLADIDEVSSSPREAG